MMYFDALTGYQHEHLQVFYGIMDNSFATITQNWVINFNKNIKTLSFHMDGHSYQTYIFYDCWGKSTCL